jgi:hypothetical protein
MRFGVVLSIENYPIACSFVRLSLSLGVGPRYDIDVYRLCLQK